MIWKKYIQIAFIGISSFFVILIGFVSYEWYCKKTVNDAIDKVMPIGEYSCDKEVLAMIKPNETTFDHPLLRPKFVQKLYNNRGYNYEYSLSSARIISFIRRDSDGSIHIMRIWPKTVYSLYEINRVWDGDNLIAAMNKAYPLFSKEFNISFSDSPNREQTTFTEISSTLDKAMSKTNDTKCKFTNEDCLDKYIIPIDVGNYRFIFEGDCKKKVISMYPLSYYKTKTSVLRLSALCIGIVLFILLIVTWQQSINERASKKSHVKDAIDENQKGNGVISESLCKCCGKEIDADSKFCPYCGKNQP